MSPTGAALRRREGLWRARRDVGEVAGALEGISATSLWLASSSTRVAMARHGGATGDGGAVAAAGGARGQSEEAR